MIPSVRWSGGYPRATRSRTTEPQEVKWLPSMLHRLGPDELRAVLDRIEAKGRGKPIGEQVLADAHGRGDERDRPEHSD